MLKNRFILIPTFIFTMLATITSLRSSILPRQIQFTTILRRNNLISHHIKSQPIYPSTFSFASLGHYHTTALLCKSADDLDPAIRAKDVKIPLDKIEFNFVRSSGPGGQNVNKVNSKAEMRFHVPSATWLAPEVRERLLTYNSNKINKEQELILSSQEHRTQTGNKDDCLMKLKKMVAEAMLTPKEREMWVGLSSRGKENRKQDRRHRSDVKANRRRIANFDD